MGTCDIKFEVYDKDEWTRDDLIGSFTATYEGLKEASEPFKLSGKNSGEVKLDALEEKDETLLELTFSAKGLKKKDLANASDPFLIIYRTSKGHKPEEVYRTNTVQNESEPRWNKIENVSKRQLCEYDANCPIKFEVFDEDKLTKKDPIGFF